MRAVKKLVAGFRNGAVRSRFAVGITCGCLALMLLNSACGLLLGGDGGRYEVAVTERSPDGAMTALVVDEYRGDSSDPYAVLVIVAPSGLDPHKAMKDRNLYRYLAMEAYAPATIGLYWQDNTTLDASCVLCKLRPRDINKQSNHLESIDIVYKGFPDRPTTSAMP